MIFLIEEKYDKETIKELTMLKVKFISDNNNNPVPFLTNSIEDNRIFTSQTITQKDQVSLTTSRVKNKKDISLDGFFITLFFFIIAITLCGIIVGNILFIN